MASHISFVEWTIAKRSISIFRGLGKREVTMPSHDVAVLTTHKIRWTAIEI